MSSNELLVGWRDGGEPVTPSDVGVVPEFDSSRSALGTDGLVQGRNGRSGVGGPESLVTRIVR